MKKMIMSIAVAVCAVIVMASCGGNGLITKGNTSEMDTLSYALGSNIGSGMKYEMSDIPFDFKAIAKGRVFLSDDVSLPVGDNYRETFNSYIEKVYLNL